MDIVNNTVNKLIDLTNGKMLLFNEIRRITLEQKDDIENNAANSIEELVKQKQVVIDRIDAIDKTFSETFDLLKKHFKISSLDEMDFTHYPTLKILKIRVGEIMSMAKDISEIEEENKSKLILIMNNLKKEMKQINVGKKSIRAYEKPVLSNDGIYIDKKK